MTNSSRPATQNAPPRIGEFPNSHPVSPPPLNPCPIFRLGYGAEGPWDHLNEVSILLRGIASSEKHAMPSLAYKLSRSAQMRQPKVILSDRRTRRGGSRRISSGQAETACRSRFCQCAKRFPEDDPSGPSTPLRSARNDSLLRFFRVSTSEGGGSRLRPTAGEAGKLAPDCLISGLHLDRWTGGGLYGAGPRAPMDGGWRGLWIIVPAETPRSTEGASCPF